MDTASRRRDHGVTGARPRRAQRLLGDVTRLRASGLGCLHCSPGRKATDPHRDGNFPATNGNVPVVAKSDVETLRAACAAARAVVLIFAPHFEAVHRYLRRRVSAELADDLAAETFIRAFQHRGRYRPERADARPWLYGIATNLLRQHFRREERELRAYARSGADPCRPDGIDVNASAPNVARALAQLTDGERDVVFLFVWADLTYEEIAEALNVPLGTVRSRLHRGRAKLRELLAPEERLGSWDDRALEVEAETIDG